MKRISNLRRFVAISVVFLQPLAPGSAETLDEIVVTADFRERKVSELPASVTVLDAEAGTITIVKEDGTEFGDYALSNLHADDQRLLLGGSAPEGGSSDRSDRSDGSDGSE